MKAILCLLFVCLSANGFGKGGGTNSIQYAVAHGDLARVKQFLAADPRLLSSKAGAGLLTEAAVHGQTQAVALLIARGADVNEKGFFGMTPLACMASAFKSPNDEKFASIAAMLIAHGAKVDAMDGYQETPLLHAVESKNPHLADVLLKNGASQEKTYGGVNFGMTPLHMAIQDSDTAMVRVLLKYHPPLDAVDHNGATPLLLAEELNRTDMVAMLHQAEPQAPLKTYATPPTKEAMRALARRIANGDATALDELNKAANGMYGDIHNYQKEHARVMVNLFRMKAAFDVLGADAGKGNKAAFQALKECLHMGRLRAFAPDALGIAAAAGYKPALDILVHYQQWDILESTAMFALYAPAQANVGPAVDDYATWLAHLKPSEVGDGVFIEVTNALTIAAAKGNARAQAAMNQFVAHDQARQR